MKKLLILVIIGSIFLVFSSCQKMQDFPKRYVLDSHKTGLFKVYTNSGEVNDSTVVSNLFDRYKKYFWKPGQQSDYGMTEIDILSETKAKITYAYHDTVFNFNLVHENGIIYFDAPDTISTTQVGNVLLKYHPICIDSVRGYYGTIYGVIPCLYFIQSNNELQFPLVSFVENEYMIGEPGPPAPYFEENVNNVFNTDYLNEIQNFTSIEDTIVFQNNQVIFREK